MEAKQDASSKLPSHNWARKPPSHWPPRRWLLERLYNPNTHAYGHWTFMLCCAVLCCAVLCCAVLCCAVLCCAVLCCAVSSHEAAACLGAAGCHRLVGML
jgi:hypothetical protein